MARAAAASGMLALAAGCGSSGAVEGEPAVVESASASVSASTGSDAADASLTEAQLAKALLEQGDLKGYRIAAKSPPDVSDVPVNAHDDVCAAVTLMAMFALGADSKAAVGGSVSATSGNRRDVDDRPAQFL